MARPQRLHFPTALFHVFARGNDKQAIFLDDADRVQFVHRLRLLKADCGFTLYAYCLMTNHFHLLVRVGEVPLSRIMHRLLSGYSHAFNRKWERRGHVFESRYHAIHCARDAYFAELLRYIHMNPVAAGLVARPEQWRWSGHRELVEGAGAGLVDRDFVLSMFGGGAASADALRDFVCRAEDIDWALPETIRAAQEEKQQAIPQDQPLVRLDSLAAGVAGASGVLTTAIRSMSREALIAEVRRRFIVIASNHGHRGSDIARFLNRSPAVISRILAGQRAGAATEG